MEANETWIDLVKSLYLKNNKVGLIPVMVYDMLELDLSDYEVKLIAAEAEERMYQDAARQGTRALKEFAHLKNSTLYQTVLETEFKRQAVAHYFTVQNNIDNF